MARKFLTAVDLGKNELQNAAVQSLGAAPSTPVKFQLYGNSGDNTLYWWDGTTWQSAKGGASSFPGYGSVPAETTFGIAKADGSAATVARSDHTHGSPLHDDAAHAAVHLSALAAPLVDVTFNGFHLINLGTPVNPNDATTKNYVDNLVNGLSWKDSVKVGTTANITLSGTQTIDGTAVVVNDRVLVKDQTDPTQNGIYQVSNATWNRASDMDFPNEFYNATVWVEQGTAQSDTAWVMTTNQPITIGTSPITWVQFSGGAMPVAGAGLVKTGNTYDVVAADASIVVAADSVAVGYAGSAANYGTAATAARSDHVHDFVYTKKVSMNCSAGTSTVVNHNLGTRQVTVDVYRNTAPYDSVECDIERTDQNNVTVRFATAVSGADFMILVFA